jgi:hypothetical protein
MNHSQLDYLTKVCADANLHFFQLYLATVSMFPPTFLCQLQSRPCSHAKTSPLSIGRFPVPVTRVEAVRVNGSLIDDIDLQSVIDTFHRSRLDQWYGVRLDGAYAGVTWSPPHA